MARLVFVIGLIFSSLAHPSSFKGGIEPLVEAVTHWVANQLQQEADTFTVIAPDKRTPIQHCQTDLAIKFPFAENQNTVEVKCSNPNWKRYLRVEVIKKSGAWALNKSLPQGTVISAKDLSATEVTGPQLNLETSKDRIIGNVLTESLSAKEVIRTSHLSEPIQVYLSTQTYNVGDIIEFDDLISTERAEKLHSNALIDWPSETVLAKKIIGQGQVIYETDIEHVNTISVWVPSSQVAPGEVVEPKDLSIEKRIKRSAERFLSTWPENTVVATTTLQPGEPILTTDVAEAEYVLRAKSTIIVGQVVTEDMVERVLEPVGKFGPEPLRQSSEVIGLEATRTIRAGNRLGVNDLIAADLIRKNEVVRLVITRGALKITVETVALEDAKIGEQVLLRNSDSGREIRGIVTGRHEARGL